VKKKSPSTPTRKEKSKLSKKGNSVKKQLSAKSIERKKLKTPKKRPTSQRISERSSHQLKIKEKSSENPTSSSDGPEEEKCLTSEQQPDQEQQQPIFQEKITEDVAKTKVQEFKNRRKSEKLSLHRENSLFRSTGKVSISECDKSIDTESELSPEPPKRARSFSRSSSKFSRILTGNKIKDSSEDDKKLQKEPENEDDKLDHFVDSFQLQKDFVDDPPPSITKKETKKARVMKRQKSSPSLPTHFVQKSHTDAFTFSPKNHPPSSITPELPLRSVGIVSMGSVSSPTPKKKKGLLGKLNSKKHLSENTKQT